MSTLAHQRVYHPRGAFLDGTNRPFDIVPSDDEEVAPTRAVSWYLLPDDHYIGGRKSFMEACCATSPIEQHADPNHRGIRRIFDLRDL